MRSSRRTTARSAEMVACFDADWERAEVHAARRARRSSGARTTAASASPISSTREAFALAAERALPGHGHHRAPGARGAARREGPHPRAAAAHAQEGQADRRRRRPAHHARRRRQGAHAQGPEAPRQDDRCRSTSAPSSARSTSPRAASTRGASSPSRPTHIMSSAGSSEVAQHDWDHSKTIDLTDEGCSPTSRSATPRAWGARSWC